jgi:putative tricarboxylic transport membrane protein
MALGVLSLVEALRVKDAWQGARLMPAALGVILVALGIGHLLPSMARQAGAGPAGTLPAWPDALARRRVVFMFGVLALYVAGLPHLGFLLATALFVLVLLRALGSYSWAMTIALTGAIAVASHVVFIHWLGMPVPSGFLGV